MSTETTGSPKPPKRSTIRRRPQSVDEFIQTGAPDISESAPPFPSESRPLEDPPPEDLPQPTAERTGLDINRYLALIALLLGVSALGVTLLERERLDNQGKALAELSRSLESRAFSPAPPTIASPPAAEPATVPPPESMQLAVPPPQTTALGPSTWLRLLALTELKLARQSLAERHDESGFASLASARGALEHLGEGAEAERSQILELETEFAATPVLDPKKLDLDLDNLHSTWLQIASRSETPQNDSWFVLPDWLYFPWGRTAEASETPSVDTDAGGQLLLNRIERLRTLAWRGDHEAFARALAGLEAWLAPKFKQDSLGQSWLAWLSSLGQQPLQRDLSGLDALVARLSSALEDELCTHAPSGTEGCVPVANAKSDGTDPPRIDS